MDKRLVEEIANYTGDGNLALATIIAAKSSSPRNTGTQMLVFPDGSISGTIGGGSDEAVIIKKAGEMIKEGKSGKLQFSLTRKEAADIGWVCGGDIDVFVEVIGKERE